MFGWLHDVSVWWLAFVIFAATFIVAAGIYALVIALAVGERGKGFKAVSPGMLPPMGLLFGLLIGFLAAQVWSDASQAQDAVNREASDLRSVVLLAHASPGNPRRGWTRSSAATSVTPLTRSGRLWPITEQR